MARQAYIVTDISYGDAGKGSIIDYLARQATIDSDHADSAGPSRTAEPAVVIRHSGGPQAAHNVVTPDGRHHTFAQFGSGSFVPGVRTHLSSHMLVNPLNMFREAEHLIGLGLHDIWERTSVDQDALVILPWQQSANQLRELARGRSKHGSCGQGVGEARVDALESTDAAHGLGAVRAGDLLQLLLPGPGRRRLLDRFEDLRATKYRQLQSELDVPPSPEADQAWQTFTSPMLIPWLAEQYATWANIGKVTDISYLERLSRHCETLLFEGSQGVLLDQWYGFYPYNTWTDTTHAGALDILAAIGYDQPVTRLGILRGYMTRHGAGPLVTEDSDLTAQLPDYHNGRNRWQDGFRVGPLDLVAHRYALTACKGTDSLAVTNLDRLGQLESWCICDRYRYVGNDPDASQYLEFDDADLVSDIRVIPPGDWHNPPVRQAQLLSQCQPVYQAVNKTANAAHLLESIEDRLGLPLSVASFGPTAADKRIPAYQ